MTKDTNGYLVTKKPKSYLRGGRMTKDTNRYLLTKNPSFTYWMDGQPRIPTGT